MPSRSSREDKNEGAIDIAKGGMKEAGGTLTGDKEKRREGRSDQRRARPKRRRATSRPYSRKTEGLPRRGRGY